MKLPNVAYAILAAISLQGADMPVANAAAEAPFAEYNRQYGLSQIHALYPWGAGATGAGSIIAIIDTGVNLGHVDIAPQLTTGGYDFWDNDSVPQDRTSADISHGTAVAGIAAGARNDLGSVGVAYNAKILPIRYAGPDFETDPTKMAAAINYFAASAARIGNLSTQKNDFAIIRPAIQNVVAADKILVFAAGNFGWADPLYPAAYAQEMDYHGIIAGAIGPDGVITSFSNRAGIFPNSQFYVVAAGSQMYAPLNAGSKSFGFVKDGTSFAAPQVTGALALLLGAFPNLSSQDAVRIILTTADKTGIYADSSIYGQGLLDIQAAMAPAGELLLPTGTSAGSSSGASSSGGGGGSAGAGLVLIVAAGVGYALSSRKNTKLEKALVLDQYDRGYPIDLRKVIQVATSKPDLTSILESMRTKSGQLQTLLPGGQQLSLYYRLPETALLRQWNSLPQEFDPLSFDSNAKPTWAMSLSGDVLPSLNYQLQFNTNAHEQFSLMNNNSLGRVSFLSASTFNAPYLSFSDTTNSLRLGFTGLDKLDINWGLVQTQADNTYAADSASSILQGEYQATDRLRLGANLNILQENGSFLGGSRNGGLSADASTTTALGLSTRYRISDHFSLLGSYSRGYTRVNDAGNSIIHRFTPLQSRAYGLALFGHSIFRNNDNFGFALSRPMKVTRGTAMLSIPTAIDAHNQITRVDEAVNLAPAQSETDFEMFYNIKLGQKMELGAYFLYENNPYHTSALQSRKTLYATLRRVF